MMENETASPAGRTSAGGLPEVVQHWVIGEPQRVWEQHSLCYFGTACWMKGDFRGIMD